MKNLPPNKSEQEVLDAIEKAVRILSPRFAFGYYAVEDIEQEARAFGLECLAKYDPSRPLENFVYIHIRNRLLNLRRKKFRRSDPPCRKCHGGHPCGLEGAFCRRYAGWLGRNTDRSNLMSPMDLGSTPESSQATGPDTSTAPVELDELCRLIDEQLSVELRATYLQMRDGVRVPLEMRRRVEEEVKEIIGCYASVD